MQNHAMLDLPSNDYHILPVTEKQLSYARQIAQGLKIAVPDEVQVDRRKMSDWIDAHKARRKPGRFDQYPSSKQVAFAERIARIKRREVPPQCFRDRKAMSNWIDANL